LVDGNVKFAAETYKIQSMKGRYITVAIALLLLALEGCQKGSAQGEPDARGTVKSLIREINWSTTGATAELLYNSDSTLRTMNYTGSGSSYGIEYRYTNKKIWAMDLGNSLYKFEYFYDNTGSITNVKRKNAGESDYRQDLEFSYNQNGTVAVLKYYEINESGKKLVYTNNYIYSSTREISAITSTAQDGTMFMFTIDSYSAPIEIDPLCFIGIDLSEYYMIYNYPVLNSMSKLPAKIRKSLIRNGQAETEQIITISNEVKRGRLEKQSTMTKYPNHQGGDSNHDTFYYY
jgi:hypothetical protein